MAPAPPILIYTPGGGVPVGPVSNPPVYSQADVTQLIEGQAYIDVVFGSVQTSEDWVLATCDVENTTDLEPLNIWPGIITERTTTGFRLQLNGMPDSSNYYLHWAVSGVNILPVPATLYLLTGPITGSAGVPVVYTVRLPASTTLSGPLTITPSDGGAGGSFNVDSVVLTNSSASATFDYTPASAGTITISVTNSGTLTDPVSISLVVIAYATGYSMTGPASGIVGVASTAFTLTLTPLGYPIPAPVTVTLSDSGGGGTFTPTTVNLTTGAPSATFTYTPSSTGAKTISVTDDGGLTDPVNLTYTAAPFDPSGIAGLKVWVKADSLALSDGTAVATWTDQSGNGNDFIQAAAANKPIYKTNRINGLPALKFDGVDDCMSEIMLGTVTTAASVFIVQRKNANSGTQAFLSTTGPGTGASPATNTFAVFLPFSDGNVYFDLGDTTATGRVNGAWGGNFTNFFVWSFVAGGGNMAVYRNGTTVVSSAGHTNSFAPAGLYMGLNGTAAAAQDADIAEVLVYNTALSSTDRVNVEGYLRSKYGL